MRTHWRRYLSSDGHLRSRRDPRGHAVDTVRDREAPGSNPGPPTSFVFKIGDFWRRLRLPGHRRGTDSPGTRRLSPVLRCPRTVD